MKNGFRVFAPIVVVGIVMLFIAGVFFLWKGVHPIVPPILEDRKGLRIEALHPARKSVVLSAGEGGALALSSGEKLPGMEVWIGTVYPEIVQMYTKDGHDRIEYFYITRGEWVKEHFDHVSTSKSVAYLKLVVDSGRPADGAERKFMNEQE